MAKAGLTFRPRRRLSCKIKVEPVGAYNGEERRTENCFRFSWNRRLDLPSLSAFLITELRLLPSYSATSSSSSHWSGFVVVKEQTGNQAPALTRSISHTTSATSSYPFLTAPFHMEVASSSAHTLSSSNVTATALSHTSANGTSSATSSSHDVASDRNSRRARGQGRGRGRGRARGLAREDEDMNSSASAHDQSHTNASHGQVPSARRGRGRPRGRGGVRGGSHAERSRGHPDPSEDRPTSQLQTMEPMEKGEGSRSKSGSLEDWDTPYLNSDGREKVVAKDKEVQAKSTTARKERFGGKLTGTQATSASLSKGDLGKKPDTAAPQAPIDYADLRSRLVGELSRGEYDCSICYSTISAKAAVWSCHQCHTVLHLTCVKQWATASVKAAEEQNAMQEDARIRERKGTWRCPGCQLAREEVPTVYLCWDGQMQDPKPSRNKKVPPHSCGRACTKAKCPHGCSAGLCHPGPCPACPVTLHHRCFCGRKEVAVRCSQLARSQTRTSTVQQASGPAYTVPANEAGSSSAGVSCGEVCNQMLNCQRHRCVSTCHPGKCNPCEETVVEKCYCGRNTQTMQCGQGKVKVCTTEDSVWEGAWQCQDKCERLFACGEHSCMKTCHPPSPSRTPCPYSPEIIKTCPCGAESRSDRKSCCDPIKTCDRQCSKPLSCGHSCLSKCHLSECPPCKVSVSAPCRCGESRPTMPCSERRQGASEDQQEAVLCDRVCRALRHCGRHECKRRCCPLSFQAKTPIGRRNRPPTQVELDEQDPARLHACSMPCGKPLACGKEGHNCSLNCHRGACPPCLRSCFEEVSCHCGRTVLEPPVPCGQRPVCRFPCARPPPQCGHPKMPHDCHEEGPCPPCVYLTTKRCDCGFNMVPNVPCHRQKVSCGSVCGALKPCGFHRCTATCHAGAPRTCGECTSICGKPKRICGHPCKAKCHAPARCDESKPCDEVITISCPCGHLRQKARCGASTANSTGTVTDQRLKCNDACLVAQRNAKLAEALGLDGDDRRVVAATTSMPSYDQEMLAFYGTDYRYATELEATLADFIRSPRHSLILASATRSQRKFTHELAQAFGLLSESLDAEPKRSVQIRRTGEARVPRIMPSEMYTRAKKDIESGLASSQQAASGPRLTSLRQNGAANASPLNALLLEGVFGLDEYAVRELLTEAPAASVASPFGSAMASAPLRLVSFRLQWAGDETVLVLPGDQTATTIQRLVSSKHEVLRILKVNKAAKGVVACSVDLSTVMGGGMPRILRREDRPTASTSTSPAASGRNTPVAWSGSGALGGKKLSGWAAVAGGSAVGTSSTPMTPSTSAGPSNGISTHRTPTVSVGGTASTVSRGLGRGETGHAAGRENTPESWDQ